MSITCLFFVLVLLAATQDIAVDGWALTLLSRKHIGCDRLLILLHKYCSTIFDRGLGPFDQLRLAPISRDAIRVFVGCLSGRALHCIALHCIFLWERCFSL